ncbi:MAG: HAMP domain-containing protein [Burkholderiales bacterium]|nr:HAMP domain-containing protein [Burkholderiales bacterium]
MKRWWVDSLSKRLFLLLWLTLVGSHWLGFWLAHPSHPAGPEGFQPPSRDMPSSAVFPPAMPPGLLPMEPGGQPGGPGEQVGLGPDSQRAHSEYGPPPHPSMWLDYVVRIGVMGVAAWLGALWLTRPMRQLAQAAQSLGQSIGSGHAGGHAGGHRIGPPLTPGVHASTASNPIDHLDDTQGPVEVRQMAHSFNEMARRLRSQFDERSLLMGAVSHDLRTPLTRLRMRLERLRPDPVVERCVQDIQDINALIEAVLDALNEERNQESAVPVDLLAMVQALSDDLAEEGQAVSAQGDQVTARVQPVALKRVLNNLISNAIRYGHSALVTVSNGRGQVIITVDDHGPGIPQAMLEDVFKPFVRLDASRHRDLGGVGLGLYIARELTLRQGGTLTLSNRTEGGLRATLTLPKASSPSGWRG